MRMRPAIVTLVLMLAFTGPLRAHRLEGLLQSSLVETLPSQIGVQVTLVPGVDIAPRIIALLDADGDGLFSETESDAWSELFMARQRIMVDGQALQLKLESTRTSPLVEMTDGHGEIVVNFSADLGKLAHGPRTVVCANHYEPFPSAYQVNGLVPQAPSVRISSHRRDDQQQEITLNVEFSNPENLATQATVSVTTHPIPGNRSAKTVAWIIGFCVAALTIATFTKIMRRIGAIRCSSR